MKIYMHENGVTLVGKAWEIREKLKEYNRRYKLLAEWLEYVKNNR